MKRIRLHYINSAIFECNISDHCLDVDTEEMHQYFRYRGVLFKKSLIEDGKVTDYFQHMVWENIPNIDDHIL